MRYLARMLTLRERSDLIKAKARELGFLACGMARAEFLSEEAPRLEQWLREGRHGEMGYMANHFDLRLDPRKLVDGAKSVISLAYNYYTPPKQQDPEAPKISTYAYGRDYHKVVKQRLKPLMQFIQEQFGAVEMRAFVDSGPVMEKAWAQRAGIGWVGKHTNVIRQQQGSFFFLCEIILDLDLAPDAPKWIERHERVLRDQRDARAPHISPCALVGRSELNAVNLKGVGGDGRARRH